MKKDKTIDDVLLRLTINARALKTIFIAPCIPSIDLMEQHILITKAKQELLAIISGLMLGEDEIGTVLDTAGRIHEMPEALCIMAFAKNKEFAKAIHKSQQDKFKTDKE